MARAELRIGVAGEEAAAGAVCELVVAAIVGPNFGVNQDRGVVVGVVGVSGLLVQVGFLFRS